MLDKRAAHGYARRRLILMVCPECPVRSGAMEPEAWSALFAGLAVLASLLGVFIAIRANGRADAANEHAARSAAAAETAAAEATRSVDIAERSEARQTERNDVVWESALVDGAFTITNTGEDDALDVVAIFTVDGERHVQEAGTVLGRGGSIKFDLNDTISTMRESNSRRIQSAARSGIAYFPSSKLMIGDRVLWVTAAGVPRQAVTEPRGIVASGRSSRRR